MTSTAGSRGSHDWLDAASLQACAVGAGGGLAGFVLGELSRFFIGHAGGRLQAIVHSAIWAGLMGMGLGLVILAHDNQQSLRGRWDRDLSVGAPLFGVLSLLGGVAGQISYMFVQNSLTRAIGWSLMGVAVGAGIGLLRRDLVQASRGAIGGGLGGFVGGFAFNALTYVSSSGGGAFSRCVGVIVMGAMIALLMRVVQNALKNAWLLGISTGPYEGKEYPLNTGQVTVGASELNDIALFREASVPPQLGMFIYHGDAWWWQGSPVAVNGAFQAQTRLQPGDNIQLGATQFRFQTRSSASPATPSAYPGNPEAGVRHYQPLPTIAVPAAPLPTLPVTAGPAWVLQNTAAAGAAIRLPAAPAQVRLGRAAQNQIVVSDPSVSSSHALLEVALNGLSITDLGSTNGTKLNGQPIVRHAPTVLRANDRLTFGRLEYVVQDAS